MPSSLGDLISALDECLKNLSSGGGGASNSRKGASPSIIIVSCVAAAVVLVAALFVWNKRQKATKQPHREASMPTVGDDGA